MGTAAQLRQHNFRLLTAANLISVTGTWMQVLGVNWLVLTLTGSPTQMGVAVMVQALPVILPSPYGGALADRLPARCSSQRRPSTSSCP